MQDEELDDIVQRLAVAKYALAAHDEAQVSQAIDEALALSRRLMSARRRAARKTPMVRSRAADSA
ncbi:MAG TPA: hypothetical protein VFH54_12460 [Mycobacteriales bacterium]|nr:hypothetical protein [Mycobacteriales bacterium]